MSPKATPEYPKVTPLPSMREQHPGAAYRVAYKLVPLPGDPDTLDGETMVWWPTEEEWRMWRDMPAVGCRGVLIVSALDLSLV